MSLGITQDTAVSTYDRWQYSHAQTASRSTSRLDIEVKDQLDGLHPVGRQEE
jgi:hypothetical protein